MHKAIAKSTPVTGSSAIKVTITAVLRTLRENKSKLVWNFKESKKRRKFRFKTTI